ncbi:hypothetical protein AVEN_68210-1 [Araneus ventricosus]|uniref:Uncharacterized protein n=1 Tax=Araneus ventricosus TaxID=182803 RepID=A0A4Y2P8L7_ARAVE|nr:hypothetical protein AVEN_68210-1 [Araneus ventricosus]
MDMDGPTDRLPANELHPNFDRNIKLWCRGHEPNFMPLDRYVSELSCSRTNIIQKVDSLSSGRSEMCRQNAAPCSRYHNNVQIQQVESSSRSRISRRLQYTHCMLCIRESKNKYHSTLLFSMERESIAVAFFPSRNFDPEHFASFLRQFFNNISKGYYPYSFQSSFQKTKEQVIFTTELGVAKAEGARYRGTFVSELQCEYKNLYQYMRPAFIFDNSLNTCRKFVNYNKMFCFSVASRSLLVV